MTHANVHWMRREQLNRLLDTKRLYSNDTGKFDLIESDRQLSISIKKKSVWMSWI